MSLGAPAYFLAVRPLAYRNRVVRPRSRRQRAPTIRGDRSAVPAGREVSTMSLMFELARTYIVIDRKGVPPFVLAEVVGCAVKPEAGLDPGRLPWSSLTTNAEEMNSNTAGSVYTREELEADPRLQHALERWEAGDDSPAAEYERRILLEYEDLVRP